MRAAHAMRAGQLARRGAWESGPQRQDLLLLLQPAALARSTAAQRSPGVGPLQLGVARWCGGCQLRCAAARQGGCGDQGATPGEGPAWQHGTSWALHAALLLHALLLLARAYWPQAGALGHRRRRGRGEQLQPGLQFQVGATGALQACLSVCLSVRLSVASLFVCLCLQRTASAVRQRNGTRCLGRDALKGGEHVVAGRL